MKLFTMALNLLNASSGAGTTGENALSNLEFRPEGFLEMLSYMGKGMLVIFILIGVIVLVTSLVNKIFSKKQ